MQTISFTLTALASTAQGFQKLCYHCDVCATAIITTTGDQSAPSPPLEQTDVTKLCDKTAECC
jgi:hypothetical protein